MQNASKVRWVWLYVVLGLIRVQIATAQPPEISTDHQLLKFWAAEALQRYRAASDIEQRRGSLGFYDSEFKVGRSQRTRIGVLKLGAAYTYTHFNFADDTDLGLSVAKPFETVHDARVSLQLSTRFYPRWFGRIGADIGTRKASGASIDDAIYSRIVLGASYQISDHFAIGSGMLVRISFAEDFSILPLLLIDWQITDRLSFRSRSDFRLSYVVDARRTLTLSAVTAPFGRKQFRLDDTSAVPSGIVELKAIKVGAALRWQPIQPLTIKGDLFAAINQELTIDDQSGRNVVDVALKNSVEIMASIRYRF